MRRNKVVVVGPSGAGKTTFFNKCTSKDFTFQEDHRPTELLDEKSVEREVDGKSISITIVDTVGSAVFGEVITAGNIFRNVRMVLCIFDVSSRLSYNEFALKKERFENLKAEIELKRGDIHRVDFLMIGAKCDMEPKVTQKEVEAFVSTLSTYVDAERSKERINFFRMERKYFTCSAKRGFGIDVILDFIAQTLANDTPGEAEGRKPSTIVLLPDEEDKSKKKHKKKLECCGNADFQEIH